MRLPLPLPASPADNYDSLAQREVSTNCLSAQQAQTVATDFLSLLTAYSEAHAEAFSDRELHILVVFDEPVGQ